MQGGSGCIKMTYDLLVHVGQRPFGKSDRELTCQDENGVPELTAEGQAGVFTCVHESFQRAGEKQRGCLGFDLA